MLWQNLNNALPSKQSTGNSDTKVLKINDVSFDHPADLVHSFNNLFCNIGQFLAGQVSKTLNAAKPSHYLQYTIGWQNFFFAPSHPQEILRIISSL